MSEKPVQEYKGFEGTNYIDGITETEMKDNRFLGIGCTYIS